MSQYCAWPQARLDFQCYMSWSFLYIFNELKWKKIVDIGGIVHHYSLKFLFINKIQWNLCNLTPDYSDILWWHPTKIYGPKVFLLTKIKPEYSDILYNPTHFPGPLVCQIRQVPLYYHTYLKIWIKSFLKLFDVYL